MKLVLIVWRDAHTVFQGWSEPDSVSTKDFTCETAGWLLPFATKPGYHVVVLSVTHEGLVGDGIAIPDENVLSITYLKECKKAS
jgi:hypothetical protein